MVCIIQRPCPKRYDIWDIINPEGDSTEPEMLAEAQDPTLGMDMTTTLTDDEHNRFGLQCAIWQIRWQSYIARAEAVRDLKDFMDSTILNNHFGLLISYDNTLKAKLKALQDDIMPIDIIVRSFG